MYVYKYQNSWANLVMRGVGQAICSRLHALVFDVAKIDHMCRELPSGTCEPQSTGEIVCLYCVHYRVRRKQAADFSVSRK